MDLTLVVLSYNHPELTGRAVRSGLALRIGKVMVVHNGTLDVHVSRLRNEFPDAHHLHLPVNAGYAGGVNAGLRAVFSSPNSLSWAILLTNDSQLLSLPVLPAAPALIAPLVFKRKRERVDSIGASFFPQRAQIFHCKSESEFSGARSAGRLPYVPGTAFLVHREVFSKTGGLNERLWMYWDDVEWSQRVLRSGFPLDVQPSWQVLHSVGKTVHRKPLYTLYYFQRNRRWVSLAYTAGWRRLAVKLVMAAACTRLFARLAVSNRWGDTRYIPRILFEKSPL